MLQTSTITTKSRLLSNSTLNISLISSKTKVNDMLQQQETYNNLDEKRKDLELKRRTYNNYRLNSLDSSVSTKLDKTQELTLLLAKKRLLLKSKRLQKEQLKTKVFNQTQCYKCLKESRDYSNTISNKSNKFDSLIHNNTSTDERLEEYNSNFMFYKSMHNFRVRCLMQEQYAILFNKETSEIVQAINIEQFRQDHVNDNAEQFNIGLTYMVILIINAEKVLGINLICKYLPMGSTCQLAIKCDKIAKGNQHYEKERRPDMRNYIVGLKQQCNDFVKILDYMDGKDKKYHPLIDNINQAGLKAQLKQILFSD